MKKNLKIVGCLVITTPLMVWLGCDNMKARHVVDRISPATPSVIAVDRGYDTVGRKWTEEELARMRQTKAQRMEMAKLDTTTTQSSTARSATPSATSSKANTTGASSATDSSHARTDRDGSNRPANDSSSVRVKAPVPAPMYSIEVKAGTVNLTIKAPGEVSVSESFCYELTVTAVDNVTNVFVEQTLSDDLTFSSSDPEANMQGKLLVWNYPRLSKGEKKLIKVCVQAGKSGAVTSCATVYTKPLYCATTMVGRPILQITQTGPEKVFVSSNATYTIVIGNKGDGTARNVVVTDPVPNGFEHESGKSVLTFQIGNLAPEESKTIPVVLKATKRGKACNVAEVTADNAEKASSEVCSTIMQRAVKITKTGNAQQFINKTANYNIVVSNIGDVDLNGVTVTDVAPAGTSFANTSGADVKGNNAVWSNIALKQGEERSFNVSLMNKNKGEYCNVAKVTTASGETDEAKACTKWLGVSALLLEVTDEPDPLLEGEETTYTVRVTNQGTAEVTNVGLTAAFSKHLEPVSAENGQVSGRNVKFNAIPSLASKETLIFKMKAKATAIGDGRVKVSLTSDILETPVTKEESTRVY